MNQKAIQSRERGEVSQQGGRIALLTVDGAFAACGRPIALGIRIDMRADASYAFILRLL